MVEFTASYSSVAGAGPPSLGTPRKGTACRFSSAVRNTEGEVVLVKILDQRAIPVADGTQDVHDLDIHLDVLRPCGGAQGEQDTNPVQFTLQRARVFRSLIRNPSESTTGCAQVALAATS